MTIKGVKKIGKLGYPFETLDPFLFGVYHYDQYPAGNSNMEAPRRGNGADFDMNAPYRMYHGVRVPGFPAHPHKGLETVTCLMEGFIDHSDSLGNLGRFGKGDVQFMTSGRGIQHSEMFPLIYPEKGNPIRLFQLWLNLPKKNKNCDPTQITHWDEDIPKITSYDGVQVTIWAGELEGKHGRQPPPDSYASQPDSQVGIFFITLKPNASYSLPARIDSINRSLYFISGSQIRVNSESIPSSSNLVCEATLSFKIENAGSDLVECLVLEGKPIGEPVSQRGPFVMNTEQELMEAFMEYRKNQFGQSWPFPSNAPVHSREMGRFVDLGDGKILKPPSK